MNCTRLRYWALLGTCGIVIGCNEPPKVGTKTPQGILLENGSFADPVGRVIDLGSKPVGILSTPDQKFVLVKTNKGLIIFDAAVEKEVARLDSPGGTSWHGLGYLDSEKEVLLTNSQSGLHVARLPEAKSWSRTVDLSPSKVQLPNAPSGASFPMGIAVTKNRVYVALNRKNAIAELDRGLKVIRYIPVGIAPYDVQVSQKGVIAVSCWSRAPRSNEETASSSGTPVPVDRFGGSKEAEIRFIAPTGQTFSVPVSSQPTQLAWINEKDLLVTCANGGTTERVRFDGPRSRRMEAVKVNGLPVDPVSNQPSSLALGASNLVSVALSGRNGIGIYRNANDRLVQLGVVSTGAFPTGVSDLGSKYAVVTSKGVGRSGRPLPKEGSGVYQFAGTVEFIDKPSTEKLAALTKRFFASVKPVSSQQQLPFSVFPETPAIEHVVYILKENRTYDQIFGDLSVGDGDPRFCVFPREVTPNHHALAEEFVLLDNFYCNGVNSADGHSWSTEGNVTAHQERSHGGWTRSYPYGDDPVAITKTGHVWDAVLDAKRTFKNFGEYDYATPVPGNATFKQIFDDFNQGKNAIKFTQNVGVKRLRQFTQSDFPGWNMRIPDVLRASRFLNQLKKWEAEGTMPNFTFLYLPQDHGSGSSAGMPTPAAHMADNDLALGQVVEGLSKSNFWAKTVVFVIEDDPQDGFDHVDGHRSICLVAGPMVKRGAVVSNFYNQTSVIRTMLHILGIKPPHDNIARSPLMAEVFAETPNLKPYVALPNRIPLDRLNGSRNAKLDLSKPDSNSDDLMNRMLWESVFPSRPYPSEWAGAHGRGLAARGLTIDTESEELEEDE